MNARNFYTKLNPSSARQYGFSKLKTKALLDSNDIATAKVYHVFSTQSDLEQVIWEQIPLPFVIKPASGSAGKGVIILKEKKPDESVWLDQDGNELTKLDLDLHTANILDGEFTTWGSSNEAIIEEMIVSHPTLAKYAYHGTPDIRIIVFNSVPIMAMTRIPTQESRGRANLDLGAIGLGIDIATGITTHGLRGKTEHITHFPDSKKKVNGIKIPFWNDVLAIAVQAAAAAGFVYMGADIFIHPDKGPMIVELNGFPGLSIQLCNRAGLKRRLERIEGIEVRNPEHGVKIGQALFAERFADKIKSEEGLRIISTRPQIAVFDEEKQPHAVLSFVDTKRFRSAISEQLANELHLLDFDDLLWQQQEVVEGKLPVVEVTIRLEERKIHTAMLVTKRLNKGRHRVELGRRDLEGFLISADDDE
ncbi:MAG: hypothetical protein A2632_03145 [Candidatus Pacebacteria bacterium RIFCSPHIGHO2_01_FULL_46_16]|nr:MAG: hypothetical protein A2632_03145 [Candidatus Pacebacteria bacterium RIFCSPHIGHO2_01_FULL_46_16]OGJ21539.1 MAG: hypothetical protein A3J60_03505 [Candidatus Pacebacteria bacterium RIFCSPHIGHO2_02_FULL_46_9]OGJ38981.1 MAG: hypothetical protein A3A82_02460 [Candidatus Pacebacteria bacterium RIFCSPLOWO2_01_FULL_47_12]